MWLSRHPHTLVVAATAIYGTALLAQWCGGRRLHDLVKVRHPDNEIFELLGVSPDGRIAYYHHAATLDGPDSELKRLHHVRIAPCSEQ